MFRLSLRNAWSRKGRLVVTAIAVIAGTAFLNGVFVFTGTIEKAFTTMFADAYVDTDAVVRSTKVIEGEFGEETRARLADSLIDVVRAVPSVAAADGDLAAPAVVVFEGEPLGIDGPPKFGGVWIDGAGSPWDLAAGRAPVGPTEVVLDRGSARFGGVEIGDTVSITSGDRGRDFTVVGIATYAGADSSGGVGWSLFDLPTAQEFLTGQPGLVDVIIVVGDGSLDEVGVAAAVSAAIDDPSVEVLTGSEITAETQDAVQRALGFITIFLSVFALISLFVGSFIIYNVFSISAAQRQREHALLRALGATRGQVTRSVFVEALVVGVLGSLAGSVAGIGLAGAIMAILDAVGFGPGDYALSVAAGGFIVTMAVGILVTLTCAVAPAVRSGRVPPLAALRDVAVDRSAVSRSRRVLGIVALVVSVVGVALGVSGRTVWLGLGVAALFVSLIVLGPFVAAPIARAVSPVLTRLRGAAGTMSGRNAARQPKRTAVTASALAVGLALMIGVATLGATAKVSLRDVIGESFTADYVVSQKLQAGFGLPPTLAEELDEAGVGRALGLAGARLALEEVAADGTRAFAAKSVVAFRPDVAAEVLDLGFVEGGFDDLTPDGILYSGDKAARDGVRVGDRVTVQLLDGEQRVLEVQGIFADDLFGNLVVDRRLFDGQSVPLLDVGVFVKADGGVSDETSATLQRVIDGFPTAKLQSRAEYIDEQDDQIDGFLNFIYALLGMSIFIAVIGIVITLWLAVYERRRELGLLRAVGMSKRQVRSTVLWESMITGVVGVVLGVALGVVLGWVIVTAFEDDLRGAFALPGATIATAAVAALVLAALASVIPARRAAKADMLDAIATT